MSNMYNVIILRYMSLVLLYVQDVVMSEQTYNVTELQITEF